MEILTVKHLSPSTLGSASTRKDFCSAAVALHEEQSQDYSVLLVTLRLMLSTVVSDEISSSQNI